MTQFEKILNHYRDNIRWWNNNYPPYKVEIDGTDFCIRSDEYDIYGTMSINDLLSPNSGFMQAVKWRSREKCIEVDTIYYDGWSESNLYLDSQREYHSFKLSILPDEDKIKYLEDNVIID